MSATKRGTATLAATIATAALIGASLAGCSSNTTIPAPPAPTAREVSSLMSVWPAYELAQSQVSTPAKLRGVGFIRFVPDASWYSNLARCTTDLDTQATLEPLGPRSADGKTALTAQVACSIEYPSDTVRARLRTKQQIDYIYTYYVNELLPCMRSNGISITAIPSRASFHLTANNGLSLWSPYEPILDTSESDASMVANGGLSQAPAFNSANTAKAKVVMALCPALPPGV